VIDLVIKNGKLVTPFLKDKVSIAIDSEKIVGIGHDSVMPPSNRTIDAGGNLILPGMIDMHTHFRDPGYTEREDFECGTKAAAAGGVTTVMDMPNNLPPTTSVKGFLEKREVVAKKAIVDFALAGGVGEGSFEDVVPLAEAGVVAFKTLMLRQEMKGQSVHTDSEITTAFSEVAKTSKPCLLHAENENLIIEATAKLVASGRLEPIVWEESRPVVSEIEAVSRSIILAQNSSVHLHLCHISAGESMQYISNGKRNGQKITAETCPNYLLLTADIMKKVGPFAKIQPPIRKTGQDLLWRGVLDGTIDVIASDHAPYTVEEKEAGWKNIFEARSGGPGVETTLPLLLNCVNEDRIGLNRLVELFAANPAKVLGLYPQKGAIAVGSDADLVIVDLNQESKIDAQSLHSKQKISPFDGMKVKGIPVMTIVRGNIVMEEGEIVVKPGIGKFITSSPVPSSSGVKT
jgi:allantoinase